MKLKVFDKVVNSVTNALGKTKLTLSRRSPEILLVLGIGGVIAGTGMAIAATDKAHDCMDQFKKNMDRIKENAELADAKPNPEQLYPVEQRKQDTRIVYGHMMMSMARIYLPAILVEAAGIALICKSHKILNNRYLAASAYGAAKAKELAEYRKRVSDAIGEDAEKSLYLGEKIDTIKELKTGDNGVTTEEEREVKILDPLDPYSRFIDSTCSGVWEKQPQYTKENILLQQRAANDILNARGFITLNEVYRMLGLEQIPEGMVLGWIKDKNIEQKIDFGLNNGHSEAVRRFVNGYEDVVLVTFNVDGNIYDMMKKERKRNAAA